MAIIEKIKMNLELILPSLDYKEAILDYKNHFREPRMFGSANLQNIATVEEWINYTKLLANSDTCPNDQVPSTTFLCIDRNSDDLVGICNIRHHLDIEYFFNYTGHIGYSISPFFRYKGYGTAQLETALQKAKAFGHTKVLMTCADINAGSRKIILANGGVYEDTRYNAKTDEQMERYWIDNP